MTLRNRISIIVPCLNEAAEIGATLDALAPLRARGHEIIVVDGGSHDDTVALAHARADRVLTTAPGRAGQMNAGAAQAHGGILLFVHADTRLPPRADFIIEAGIAKGHCWGRFDVEISGKHPLLRVIATAINARSRWTRIATGDQGIFVTRTCFEKVGGFPDMRLMEDVALTTMLKRRGAPFCIGQRVVTSGRRWETHGVIRTVLLMWRLRLAYWLGTDPDDLARLYATHRRP
jgi:rSAM/selenodomain-associated transferase 2